jgi:hypothetical protein
MTPELKAQLDESLKLTRQMLDRTDGLETQIKALEAKGVGSADLKEQVERMSKDNAKAIDQINASVEAAKAELTSRQDEFEASRGGTKAHGVPSMSDAAIKTIEQIPVNKRVPMPGQSYSLGSYDAANILKAVTSLAASAGDAIVGRYDRDIVVPGQQAITLLDILPVSFTDESIVYWVEEVLASRTNNAAALTLDKQGTAQTTAYGESDFVFNELSAEVRSIGHFATVSQRTLADVKQLRAYIEGQMRYMTRYKLEQQILDGSGAGVQITGIKAAATAYDATLDNTIGVTALQNLDVIRLAALQVALTHFPASAVILHPNEVAGMELLKDGNDGYLLVNPAGTGALRPWGLPVVGTTQQTAGEFTIGAFNMAVEVVMRQEVELLISTEHSDNFTKRLATILSDVRAALKTYRATSLVDGVFATAKA